MNRTEQIGELSVTYNEEGLGTLVLDIYQLKVGEKTININERLTEKDNQELSEALTVINDILMSKINTIIEESIKEGEDINE